MVEPIRFEWGLSDLQLGLLTAAFTVVYAIAGLPLGLLLAFFTVGPMAEAFDDWRAPFFIAAVPGLLLAGRMFLIREPQRGASETLRGAARATGPAPIGRPLRIPTLRWVILSGVTMNFASYAGNGFLVPMLQRSFGLPLD